MQKWGNPAPSSIPGFLRCSSVSNHLVLGCPTIKERERPRICIHIGIYTEGQSELASERDPAGTWRHNCWLYQAYLTPRATHPPPSPLAFHPEKYTCDFNILDPSPPFCVIETSWRLLRMWEQFWFQGTHLCFETRAGCLTLLWEVNKSSARSPNTAAACWAGLKMERNLFARFGDDPFQKHSGKWIQLMDPRYIYPPFGEEYPPASKPHYF